MISLLQRVTLQKRQSNQSAFAPAYGLPKGRQIKNQCKTKSTARRGGLQADLFSEAHFSEQVVWQQSIYRWRA